MKLTQVPSGFLLCSLLSVLGASAVEVTPIQKVIQLLQELHDKGTQEKNEEATRFSRFEQWCEDQSRVKKREIEKGTSRIAKLTAQLEKDHALIKSLSSRIEELDADIDRWNVDTEAITTIRKKESKDYRATSTDYDESLAAIDGAIAVLKKKATKTAQTEALLQVANLRRVSVESKSALIDAVKKQPSPVEMPAPVEMPDERLSVQNPEAYGYEFQSGGVVELLERLKDDFSKQKYELDKDELNAKHAFEQMAAQLQDNREAAKHEVDKKTVLRSDTQANKAAREGEKSQTQTDLAEDQTYLNDAEALCMQKSSDFSSRQKLREEELKAVAEAISIISADSVQGAGEKHLPALASIGTSLAQLRKGSGPAWLQSKVSNFLENRAKEYHSDVLASLSQRISDNPFGKVKKMIRDLISQLMEEATTETEHKGWCDTELSTNKLTRDHKSQSVTELTVKKDDLTATIVDLTQDVEDLTLAVSELDEAMAQATQERQESKETNEKAIEEAKTAQEAVQRAIAVMKDFYAKSAQATALIQEKQQVKQPAMDAPETFDKPYQGLLPEGGNVVDFLEVILTDFSRLEAETRTTESTEQDQHDKFMFESKKDKALKENEIGHKTEKKQNSQKSLQDTERELALTQEQLDKALKYYEKLKPTCVDSGITYEERVERRKQEIQSLKEALAIMTGTDLS